MTNTMSYPSETTISIMLPVGQSNHGGNACHLPRRRRRRRRRRHNNGRLGSIVHQFSALPVLGHDVLASMLEFVRPPLIVAGDCVRAAVAITAITRCSGIM